MEDEKGVTHSYLVFIFPRGIANVSVYFRLTVCIIIGKHNLGILSLSTNEELQLKIMYNQLTLLQSCTAYRLFGFFRSLLYMMNPMTVVISTPRSIPPNNTPKVLPTLFSAIKYSEFRNVIA